MRLLTRYSALTLEIGAKSSTSDSDIEIDWFEISIFLTDLLVGSLCENLASIPIVYIRQEQKEFSEVNHSPGTVAFAI
jgi:hypothetical protein